MLSMNCLSTALLTEYELFHPATTCQYTSSWGSLSDLLLIVGFYWTSFIFIFHFCCLIVLVQSQSLSRRTTPFAPRVQVMGPVWRALSLWSLLIHCWLAFFFVCLFPFFGKCIPWEMAASSFPYSAVYCVLLKKIIWFHSYVESCYYSF